ncbi:MAG TPA: hypothetical protein VMJ10_18405 [Kofleriaceae bacterium]|nr:hypothetical protein [Kofleriaceae bacterium]
MRRTAVAWTIAVIAVTEACGRIGFDPTRDGRSDALANVRYLYRNDDGTGLHGLDALLNGDLSYGDGPPVDFRATSHLQPFHIFDLHIPVGRAWSPIHDGGKPVGPGDISGYTQLIFDLFTSYPSDQFDSSWPYDNNVFSPAYVDDITSVPGVGTLANGEWTRQIRIPLAYFGYLGMKAFFRFALRDNAHVAHDSYWDNIGLVAGSYVWIYDGGAPTTWDGATWKWTAHDASAPLGGWSDASVGATANYAFDPTQLSQLGAPSSLNGLTDPGIDEQVTNVIELAVTAPGGAWKVTHPGFALAPYTTLTFGLLATAMNHAYRVQLYDTSGTTIGSALDPTPYTNHDWGAKSSFTVYCVPLTAFGSLPAQIGGLSIEDATGAATNTIYVSAVGFFD